MCLQLIYLPDPNPNFCQLIPDICLQAAFCQKYRRNNLAAAMTESNEVAVSLQSGFSLVSGYSLRRYVA